MKNLRNIKIAIFTIALVLGIYSCTSDTEYLKYVGDGEISYTGAIDSLEIYPGNNRVQVNGLIIGDPKVSEARIYWNNNKDSVVVPIDRTSGIDEVVEIIEGLEESVLNFVVRTFDKNGNSSIPVSMSAEVYGERYIASLYNRPLVSNVLIGNSLTINFAEMDLSTGVLGSEVEYTTTEGSLNTVFVDIEDSSVEILDFEGGSTYQYRTAFIPEETSIDDFYTAFESVKPIPTPVLINAAVPFTYGSVSGRWGILTDWITSDSAKNHDGFGGLDTGCCGVPGDNFNMESGWGAPDVANGKIYQVVNAEPATYQLRVNVHGTNHNDTDAIVKSYFVITKGNGGLPDVDVVETAPEVLNYKRLNGAGEYVVEFTVDETTDISVGQLSHQVGGGGWYANILSFEIIVVN